MKELLDLHKQNNDILDKKAKDIESESTKAVNSLLEQKHVALNKQAEAEQRAKDREADAEKAKQDAKAAQDEAEKTKQEMAENPIMHDSTHRDATAPDGQTAEQAIRR